MPTLPSPMYFCWGGIWGCQHAYICLWHISVCCPVDLYEYMHVCSRWTVEMKNNQWKKKDKVLNFSLNRILSFRSFMSIFLLIKYPLSTAACLWQCEETFHQVQQCCILCPTTDKLSKTSKRLELCFKVCTDMQWKCSTDVATLNRPCFRCGALANLWQVCAGTTLPSWL